MSNDASTTVRDYLTRKLRLPTIIAFSSWGLFAIGLLSVGDDPPLWAVAAGITCIVFFASCVIYFMFGIRCPRCGNNLGPTISGHGSPLSFSKKLRFCPFCALAFDSSLDEARARQEP